MAGAILWLEFAQYAMVRKVSIWNCGIRNTWHFGFAILLFSGDLLWCFISGFQLALHIGSRRFKPKT